MIFITSDETKKDEEIEKFITYLGYYPNLFDEKKQTKIESHIYNYIGEINVKNDSTYVEEGVYGDAIKQENNKFKIRYASGEGKQADRFAAIHELGHVLLTPKDKYEYNNQFVSAQGPCKYNTNLHELYGLGILEGTVNVIAKITIIKQDHNKYLEEYLNNGGCDFKKNRYKPLEEIARLLVIASTPHYNEDPVDYLISLIRNQRIDDEKSSSYLNSCFNNDFSFEKEFDKIFNNNYTCYELFKDIDIIYNQLMKNKTYNKEQTREIILKINSYYYRKLQQQLINGRIDSDKLEQLENNFNNHIEKVLDNLGIRKEVKSNAI